MCLITVKLRIFLKIAITVTLRIFLKIDKKASHRYILNVDLIHKEPMTKTQRQCQPRPGSSPSCSAPSQLVAPLQPGRQRAWPQCLVLSPTRESQLESQGPGCLLAPPRLSSGPALASVMPRPGCYAPPWLSSGPTPAVRDIYRVK